MTTIAAVSIGVSIARCVKPFKEVYNGTRHFAEHRGQCRNAGARMKRRTECKGYTTKVGYDGATGSFKTETVDHGFADTVRRKQVATIAEPQSAVIIQKPASPAKTIKTLRRKTPDLKSTMGLSRHAQVCASGCI